MTQTGNVVLVKQVFGSKGDFDTWRIYFLLDKTFLCTA